MPLSSQINGEKITAKNDIGRPIHSAVLFGPLSAIDFGINSPMITCRAVIMKYAMPATSAAREIPAIHPASR